MAGITVHSMAGHPEWIAPCAAWWHRQWGEDMGYSLDAARSAIEGLAAPYSGQAAMVALVDGTPAGSAFLVEKDLETHTHLGPWLAGLFVLPQFRQMGIGKRLSGAVAEEAGRLGHASVYLYTSIGRFYRRQGWEQHEEVLVHDVAHEVMVRVL
jgi:GNAT superfamily N-acetyltransferase